MVIDKLKTNTPIKNIFFSCNKYIKEVNYNSKSHKKSYNKFPINIFMYF